MLEELHTIEFVIADKVTGEITVICSASQQEDYDNWLLEAGQIKHRLTSRAEVNKVHERDPNDRSKLKHKIDLAGGKIVVKAK
ncbi:MAG: hypothetical protein IH874_03895 [Candidatus Dadabacteria bacterium]|nr:hypothetical protein [Candidatus Dadabacteria bacterium]